ncbi:hypothetical protein ACIRON_02655 [Nocardioides sp. NPDC101246]
MDVRPTAEKDRVGALSHDRPCGHCGHPGTHELLSCDLCPCHESDHT